MIPVVISVYKDRTYSFELKSRRRLAVLLKKAAGLAKAAGATPAVRDRRPGDARADPWRSSR